MMRYGRDYGSYGFRGGYRGDRGGYDRAVRWNGGGRGGAERVAFGPRGRGERLPDGPVRPGWSEPRRGMGGAPYDRSYQQIHRGRSGRDDGTYDRAGRFGRPYGG